MTRREPRQDTYCRGKIEAIFVEIPWSVPETYSLLLYEWGATARNAPEAFNLLQR